MVPTRLAEAPVTEAGGGDASLGRVRRVALLDAAEKILGSREVLEILQLSRRGGLALVMHKAERCVFKFINCRADWKKRLARPFGWNPARRALRISGRFEEVGLPLCPVLEYGDVPLASAPRAVWTLSQYVKNGRTFRQIKQEIQGSALSPKCAITQRLFESSLRLLKRVHDLGFEHRDYHAGNLFIVPGDRESLERGEGTIHLLDFETTQERKPTPTRRSRDLKRFLMNFVEPENFSQIIDQAMELYCDGESTLRRAIMDARFMRALLKDGGR